MQTLIRSLWVLGIFWLTGSIAGAIPEPPTTRKVVFLAGTKSHGPGDHEYERGLRQLAHAIRTSPDTAGWRTEVHLHGWPEDPRTLDDADAIVVYSDGSDRDPNAHPLLLGDRLELLQRQMRRGCGLVLLHYATFAPVGRGGDQYLEWAGGHFDYQTGKAPNHWASAIQFHDAKPFPAAVHPINRGLAPFALKDEYYYRMRFRPDDKRRTDLLKVTLPGEAEPQTVAWAVQRGDGGRGFSFTGGHVHANWRNDNLRRFVVNGIVWSAKGTVPEQGIRSAVPDDIDQIRLLMVTGHHHPAHDWRATTAAMREITSVDDRVKWTVVEDPESLSGDLTGYDAIVVNYCNWERPSLGLRARENLLRYVRRGGGLFLLHFANGAWRDWPAYSGGLSRRVWVDGKANHDAYGPFTVRVAKPEHPLVKGIADFATTDELYCSQVGLDPVDPLLTARSKVTGKDEPLAYVYNDGKGRVFQTLLGHDAGAVRTPAHAEVIRRAIAWVARREILPQAVASTLVPTPAKASEGRFGGAWDGRSGVLQSTGRPEWQEPPLTVDLWAKLDSKSNFNILAANSDKSSARHWEIYTEAGTGRLSVYLPGASPTNVVAPLDLCDGRWHAVRFEWLPGRVRLLVDGRKVADENIGMPHATATIGPLWIAGYPRRDSDATAWWMMSMSGAGFSMAFGICPARHRLRKLLWPCGTWIRSGTALSSIPGRRD
jgi:type 1 glutamine amidotransferase